MSSDPPLPFAFSDKKAFFALPPEKQPPHIWECLQYLEWHRAAGIREQREVDRNVAILRHIAFDVAKDIAARLQTSRAYVNRFDPRWPRFHPDSRDPLYATGCHPPLTMCVPDSDEEWKDVRCTDDNLRELAEWLHTPAGMHVSNPDMRTQVATAAEELRIATEEALRAEKEAFAAREKVHRLMEQEKRR